MDLRHTCILFFLGANVFSQNIGLPGEPRPNEGLQLESFGYPIFFGGEQHSSFHLKYPITNTIRAELNTFYDTYILSDRIRTDIQLKKYLDDNWYLFSGIESEFSFNKYPGLESRKQAPPRIGVISGLGYEVNENFTMEAQSNFQINNAPIGAYGEHLIPMPQVYTLKGKIKF
ncbi:hypothetical protein [Maribacter sp. 4G9]|uniref:hypothetical protein n=1 Tax=Maribacter sp. 4G9 TaxID=1889777 RepID=UPI000C147B83|nr:hypothetical protein [Maribacter sp. 4G9]PIB25281.1 hypothetical protein BFP75_09630 [Maribacter sp. 4G9]